MASTHSSFRASFFIFFAALFPVVPNRALTPQMKAGLAPSEQPRRSQEFSGFVQKTAYPGDYLDYRSETCAVYSDEYRFIWVKLRRCGSTSVLQALKGSLCGVVIPEHVSSDVLVNHLAACPHPSILNHHQGTPNDCNLVPPSKEKWESYFVFTFTRDPWSRWDSLQRWCEIGEDFCSACGTQARGDCPQNHIVDQSGYVMSPAANGSYVDFAGRLETLGADLEAALSEVDRRYRARTGRGIAWTNQSVMTDQWVNAAPGHSNNYCECPECISAVSDAYRRDVELLGYDAPTCIAAAP